MCGFCNLCVCVCLDFVMCGCVYVWVGFVTCDVCVCGFFMCGCFADIYTCIYCAFVLFLLLV